MLQEVRIGRLAALDDKRPPSSHISEVVVHPHVVDGCGHAAGRTSDRRFKWGSNNEVKLRQKYCV